MFEPNKKQVYDPEDVYISDLDENEQVNVEDMELYVDDDPDFDYLTDEE